MMRTVHMTYYCEIIAPTETLPRMSSSPDLRVRSILNKLQKVLGGVT